VSQSRLPAMIDVRVIVEPLSLFHCTTQIPFRCSRLTVFPVACKAVFEVWFFEQIAPQNKQHSHFFGYFALCRSSWLAVGSTEIPKKKNWDTKMQILLPRLSRVCQWCNDSETHSIILPHSMHLVWVFVFVHWTIFGHYGGTRI